MSTYNHDAADENKDVKGDHATASPITADRIELSTGNCGEWIQFEEDALMNDPEGMEKHE